MCRVKTRLKIIPGIRIVLLYRNSYRVCRTLSMREPKYQCGPLIRNRHVFDGTKAVHYFPRTWKTVASNNKITEQVEISRKWKALFIDHDQIVNWRNDRLLWAHTSAIAHVRFTTIRFIDQDQNENWRNDRLLGADNSAISHVRDTTILFIDQDQNVNRRNDRYVRILQLSHMLGIPWFCL